MPSNRSCLLFAAVFAVLVAPVSAQEITGTITGTVTDNTGAVLPGTSVSSRNLGMGLVKTTVANESGHYTIPFLPVGEYELTFSLTGFTPSTVKVRLHVNDRLAVNASLQVGPQTEVV